MSYPQFQAASDYLGAIADEDYVKALPSNSYEDRGGAVLDGSEAGYKATYTQADAEAVTAEDGRVILMDEHLADSDAMDYDMDRADGEWAFSAQFRQISVISRRKRIYTVGLLCT